MKPKDECCSICGKCHATEFCPTLDNVTIVEDTFTLSRARLTLPKGLVVQNRVDGSTSVIAKVKFKCGVQFGPFLAKTSSTLNPSINFPLKLFIDGDDEQYLETSDESVCNWMCLVANATFFEEQNLFCYQMKKQVYFLVIKDLNDGDELKVWYAPHYAIQMSAVPLPSENGTDHMDNMNQDSGSATDHEYLGIQKKKCRPKKIKPNDNTIVDLQLKAFCVDKLHPVMLGANEMKYEWTCSMCGLNEFYLSKYAQHLMTHYKSNLNYDCPSCHKLFKTAKMLKEHRELCPKTKKLSPTAQSSDVSSSGIKTGQPDQIETSSSLNNLQPPDILNSSGIEGFCKNLQLKRIPDISSNMLPVSNTDMLGLSRGKDDSFEYFNFESLNVDSEFNYDSSLEFNKKEGNVQKKSPRKCWNNDILSSDVKDPPSINSSNTGGLCNGTSPAFRTRDLDHLDPPILDLGDELVFQNIKSFSSTETGLDKSVCLNKTVDNDQSQNSGNLTRERSADKTKSEENGPIDFLVLKYEQPLEVTDEDKNRLVENLIRDSEKRMNMNVFDVNSDAELMKEMLSDGAFSTTDQARCSETNNSSMEFKEIEISNLINDKKIKKEKEKSKELFSCDICKKKFTRDRYLYRHLKRHTGEFTCMSCMTVFARKENLEKHQCSLEVGIANLQRKECVLCGKFFRTKIELKKHRAQHKDRKKYQKTDTAKLLICETCGFTCSSKRGLSYHIMTHGNRKFSCPYCEKKFYRNDLLKWHVKTHRTAQEVCPVCQKKFQTKKSLNLHLTRHTGSKRFKCDRCEKEFFQKGNLMKHLRIHERPTGPNECEKQTKEAVRNVTYVCRYCKMSIRFRHSLKRHLLKRHASFKHEWDIPGGLDLMCESPPKADTDVISNKVVQETEMQHPTQVNIVQEIPSVGSVVIVAETEAGQECMSVMPAPTDGLSTVSGPVVTNTTNENIIGVSGPQALMQSVSVADFLQLNGNGSAPVFILEDGTLIQSDVQLDKDFYYCFSTN